MKRAKPDTPNPFHCPPSRLVKLKEIDTLKHLVRKYPDVAIDYLTLTELQECLSRHGLPTIPRKGDAP